MEMIDSTRNVVREIDAGRGKSKLAKERMKRE
jgi:hypothetical protein